MTNLLHSNLLHSLIKFRDVGHELIKFEVALLIRQNR